MEEIVDCIKDHHYSAAISKQGSPEEVLANSILDKIPLPPEKNTKKKPNRVEAAKKIKDETLKAATFESLLSEPIGRFFLGEVLLLEGKEKKVVKQMLEAFDNIQEFRINPHPNVTDINVTFDKLSPISGSFSKVVEGAGKKIKTFTNEEIEEKNETSDKDKEALIQNVFEPIVEAMTNEFKGTFEKFKNNEELLNKYLNVSWFQYQPITFDDFVIFRDLGRGAFGVVSAAKHRYTGQMVALKGMNRKLVKGKKMTKLVKAEKKILQRLGERPSPFTVWLKYCFMNHESMFMALPLMTGGDLQYQLCSRGAFDVKLSRFYAAEIMLGLNHLHSMGIVYRDLKPENVLLDELGHTRISDMGLATIIGYTPDTIGEGKLLKGKAGTPGYWPPEMILGKGYGFDADWWSYGVMLFEFVTGYCPFSESRTNLGSRDEATLKWNLQFPNIEVAKQNEEDKGTPFPEDLKDVILSLLNRDRSKRLGVSGNTVDVLKAHPFFSSLDWKEVTKGTMKPPWCPPKNRINAVAQADLADRNKEHEYRKIKLTEADNIPGLEFTANLMHQRDIVKVLELERDGQLAHLDKQASSACSIL